MNEIELLNKINELNEQYLIGSFSINAVEFNVDEKNNNLVVNPGDDAFGLHERKFDLIKEIKSNGHEDIHHKELPAVHYGFFDINDAYESVKNKNVFISKMMSFLNQASIEFVKTFGNNYIKDYIAIFSPFYYHDGVAGFYFKIKFIKKSLLEL